ncbi:elongation factor 4 [Candidatus Azambacteria bacterium RIFOXYC1_FULL_41_20]|nr:MAG: Elongation factor 4 [Candidatus Azambacteria bacterium GW2011_GWC2_43_27]OGD41116.1 MAG: elongation factor 4 [Candidatus Azambacteria bacterium RIFOXYB1_FULL_40_33]OGD42490.1 MAG: elongation factor 4 [Candidatus Azambacteria bacterium RIFOXYA1_FULL_42_37]OGD43600.1 MAG: elongation factor 4 [Candidatus Azambacteria bacterium RIFOXYC1_FULL_41_20]OGD47393.1 MAG: elongation factor 4 [Candidatus Azambacteria bacterium RIFOXYD1_FULL_42_38]HAJ44757.1 elongation factor 4 [Candidatus Azambacter
MNIRNFVIIAHIDHGKSTLADRFLEITGTVSQRKMREQFLDQMDLERERGITIKMQPVRMNFKYNSEDYILNLIDTPGHVDFTYEVSRALAAVEGAILLVDATQGIQAQTIANLYLAKKENLKIIGVINKLDLVDDPEKIEMLKQEIAKLTDQKPEEILAVSAKTGLNAEKILEKVIEKFPEPKINIEKPFQALVFDSHFDAYKGVLAYIRVVEGEISKQKLINALATKSKIQILETGVFKPELTTVEKLSSGEIGYIATGLKNPTLVRVGDTLATNPNAEPLPGYTEPKSMVWASFYPEAADDFDLLKDALSKLKLNDAALHYEPETQEALGRGFRLGFLGMLHLDITAERLKREYNRQVIITTPTVSYRIKNRRKEILEIFTPADWPDSSQIESIEEPWIRLGILMPTRYLGGVMNLVGNYRGVYRQTDYLGMDHLILNFDIPLSDILVDFHDRLKSASEGYASMNYEFLGYKPGSLVKLQVLIAGESVEAFSKIVSKEKAYNEGNALVKKLKDIVPKQYFPVALQAAIGGKVIARETIPAMRKDVTGYLYGGDVTRKNKLLEKQKKGKKRRATFNRVQLDSEVYLKMFRNAQ